MWDDAASSKLSGADQDLRKATHRHAQACQQPTGNSQPWNHTKSRISSQQGLAIGRSSAMQKLPEVSRHEDMARGLAPDLGRETKR